jgi:hypothetical protein
MKYEIIKGDNSSYIFSTTHKIITEIVSKEDKATMKAIERYCEENNIIPNIIEKERLDLVLRLGIAELNKRELESKGE